MYEVPLASRRFERTRLPIRRKAIAAIRRSVDGLPDGSNVVSVLRANPRIPAAAYTLHAMGFTVSQIATFIERPLFTEEVVIQLLAESVRAHLLLIIELTTSPTTTKRGYP